MKITLEVENTTSLTEEEFKHWLTLTLKDSFYEFVSHRGPTAEAYVERRYTNDFAESWKKRKIQEVNNRIMIADRLWHASFHVEIE